MDTPSSVQPAVESGLRGWLAQILRPQSVEDTRAHKEFLLNVALVVMGMLSLIDIGLSAILSIVGLRQALIFLAIGVLILFACWIGYQLSRREHLRIGGTIPPIIIWGTVSVLLALGGWHMPLVAGYVICVAMATLFIGLVGGLSFSLISLLAYGLLGWQYFAGNMPSFFASAQDLLLPNIVILGIFMIGACVLFYVLDRQLARISSARLATVKTSAEQLQKVADERQDLIVRLEQTTKDQERLLKTVQRISAPVLPLFEGMITMPIIGELSPQRASLLLEDMMHGISNYHADDVLLDLTGMTAIDDLAAQRLIQAIQGARILGSTCRLVGIQPDIAQTLVRLELDLGEIETYSTLQEGLSALLPSQQPDVPRQL